MSEALTAAFAGFRHMHIFDVYELFRRRADVRVVAACEEDEQTRARLQGRYGVRLTHDSFTEMLAGVRFDVLVLGDVFARRAGMIIEALRAGRHVLSDKPICTELAQLQRIESLAGSRSRIVAGLLELRHSGAFLRARQLIRSGEIGELHTVTFSGQHPLFPDSRPRWYFEGDQHGGTINDIAIHAVDILQWLTGRGFQRVVAARCWNAGFRECPEFGNAAQLMLVMEGGCGVIGDVSYISPEAMGYTLPQYWRFDLWGDGGMMEVGLNLPVIRLYRRHSHSAETIQVPANRPAGYLEELKEAIRDSKQDTGLFAATRLCLRAQALSEENR